MPRKLLPLLLLVPALSACGGSGGKVASATTRPAATSAPSGKVRTPVRAPVAARPAVPRPQVLPGLEGVIGATTEQLAHQFGPARLDVWEGDARKLQYSGNACVLDIYLYPSAAGREPQATYVDARRASDGEDVDRAACVAALRKR